MITKCPYLCGPDVLFHSDCITKSLQLDYTGVTDGVIKGGSPINAAGRVANDATAIGILRRDCYEGYHQRGQVIIDGYVRQDIAQENSGIALADAAMAAMAKVLFVDASGVPHPSSGGGYVPKPLTYDYMPDGYPKKERKTVTLLEDEEADFDGKNGVAFSAQFDLVVGQTYVAIWDGAAYERVAKEIEGTPYFGNLAIQTGGADNTGEPFLCALLGGHVVWFAATAATHTVGLSLVTETPTPMAEEFMPVLTSPNGTKYKLTVDDTGTISATEVT